MYIFLGKNYMYLTNHKYVYVPSSVYKLFFKFFNAYQIGSGIILVNLILLGSKECELNRSTNSIQPDVGSK